MDKLEIENKIKTLKKELNQIKKDSDSLKLTINGSFGKFGSIYSILYSPQLIIQTTITGQLSLLMLIERFEENGIKVISANTDGIVSKVPKKLDQKFTEIYQQWEKETCFKLEETVYKSLHSRDVNNYIAIKTDGKVKHKGAYSNHWNDNSTFRLHKNPTNLICIDAVTAYLTIYKPIEETIRECTDITKFITVRYVKGGAAKLWPDYINDPVNKIEYLGKAVRFYRSNTTNGEIVYCKTGNKVPLTENCKPCMELPEKFPDDINFDWYISESYRILKDIGVINE